MTSIPIAAPSAAGSGTSNPAFIPKAIASEIASTLEIASQLILNRNVTMVNDGNGVSRRVEDARPDVKGFALARTGAELMKAFTPQLAPLANSITGACDNYDASFAGMYKGGPTPPSANQAWKQAIETAGQLAATTANIIRAYPQA